MVWFKRICIVTENEDITPLAMALFEITQLCGEELDVWKIVFHLCTGVGR